MTSSLLLDYRSGSKELSLHEPIKSLLEPCTCVVKNKNKPLITCKQCYSTGRVLSELSSGDIAFVGNGPDNLPIMIGVEFKSISDLISSIYTGRLQDTQLGGINSATGMLNDYGEVWILYYGRYRLSPKDNRTLQIYKEKFTTKQGKEYYAGFYDYLGGGKNFESYRYLESFLSSPSLTHLGIQTKHVETIEQAAIWLGILYNLWQRPYDSHRSMKAISKSTVTVVPGLSEVERLMLSIASELPGLRDKRAYAAVEHFNSVSDMVNATCQEWESIPGIGKVLGRSIVEIVNRKKKENRVASKSSTNETINNKLSDIVKRRSGK